MRQYCAILASTRADRDAFTPLEEFIGYDGVMDLLLKDQIEALEANWHAILGPLHTRFLLIAKFAKLRHLSLL